MKKEISHKNQEVKAVTPTPSPVFIAQPDTDLPPKFYTIHQAAALMGFATITLRCWISQQKCPFKTVRVRGKRLVVAESFDDFLNGVEGDNHNHVVHICVFLVKNPPKIIAKKPPITVSKRPPELSS